MDTEITVDPFDINKISLSDHIIGEINLLLQKKIETSGANLSNTQKKLLLVGKAL
jgi:ABC-type molybdenum transport system ATPase subunit/photorepair protein PhrA